MVNTALKAARLTEGERQRWDRSDDLPPKRGKASPEHKWGGVRRTGGRPLGGRECSSDNVGCRLLYNRKCGNKKKCLQTQKDAWQEKTGAKPRRDKFSSLKLGDRRENDMRARCSWSKRWAWTKTPKNETADGRGEEPTSTTKGQWCDVFSYWWFTFRGNVDITLKWWRTSKKK